MRFCAHYWHNYQRRYRATRFNDDHLGTRDSEFASHSRFWLPLDGSPRWYCRSPGDRQLVIRLIRDMGAILLDMKPDRGMAATRSAARAIWVRISKIGRSSGEKYLQIVPYVTRALNIGLGDLADLLTNVFLAKFCDAFDLEWTCAGWTTTRTKT